MLAMMASHAKLLLQIPVMSALLHVPSAENAFLREMSAIIARIAQMEKMKILYFAVSYVIVFPQVVVVYKFY